MGDMLSQAEIDALLNGTSLDAADASGGPEGELTPQEIDALGEIGNISMGTSATTLFTLLGQKVVITTPQVTVSNWDDISSEYSNSYVAVRVEYTHGLVGSNLLIMKEQDVKVITDLMMGGDGNNTSEPLSDLHLSAISEAMNQMVGSSSTSMSAMFDKRIDISPPKAFILDLDNMQQNIGITGTETIVKIAFKMIVGTLIDSEIMQILPISFAKKLVENLLNMDTGNGTFSIPSTPKKPPEPQRQNMSQPQPQPQQFTQPQQYVQPQQQPQQFTQQQQNYQTEYGYETPAVWNGNDQKQAREPVNVQPAHFQNFDDSRIVLERKNISLIMDVPLQVTVELGRTQKLIKDILEFGPGSIIELDKLAGEPVDILVNGKAIAKGEVVVIDESFGVRITDIIHPSKRL
jgi:flagellar motor switch protein FliN/FliY